MAGGGYRFVENGGQRTDSALGTHFGVEADGYMTEEDYHKWKQEGDLIYHVHLKASENDVWGIFYSYPIEVEEGWGRELPVIADTFAADY